MFACLSQNELVKLRGSGGVSKTDDAKNEVSENNEPLTTEHLKGAFLLLIFVYVAATATFLVELLSGRLMKGPRG